MIAPLVVTLAIEDDAQRRFAIERRRWFPPGRTQVGAHVTLFHAVPGEREGEVRADLAAQAGPGFDVRVAAIMSLGLGVAYALESTELTRRHRALQQAWWPHLTAQDRQRFRPHVTVQNKVDPDTARSTRATLEKSFAPYDVAATGFVLWRYDGGPWAELARVPFDAG